MKKRHAACLTLVCIIAVLVAALATGARASRRMPARASGAAARVAAQTFNLSDFGAVGDGQTDDGPALQAALDAVVAAGGGTLLVPAGRFLIITPVTVSFEGLNASLELRGVESNIAVPPPTASGNELTQGLNLTSEFVPATGEQRAAVSFWHLRSLLIKDISFMGSPDAFTDALTTLAIANTDDAVIQHCEFYGISSLVPAGSVVQAMLSHLTIRQTEFLGCTANSGLYTPIVQNWEWKGITVEDTIFADYGQRAELYAKTGLGSPLCWVNVGHAAPPSPDSPRREVVLRRLFLDEGGWQGITSQPSRYQSPTVPIDLFYATGLYVNVSNFGTTGLYISGVGQVLVEDSNYTWSHNADAAIHIADADDAILDRIQTSAAATRLRANAETARLTVINSVYEELASVPAQTFVLNTTTPDDDPVLYVRNQFQTMLGREPDAAAHYNWSRAILDCGTDAACVTGRHAALAAYLATNPAPTFAIKGRAADENGQPLEGADVTLSGSQSAATTTGADGSYSFGRLPTSAAYTVTISKRHYTFATPSKTIAMPAGAQVLDFDATLNRHSISGRLTDERGIAIQDATVTLSGDQSAATTSGVNGDFSFDDLPAGGNYTVTVSGTRHTFDNPSQTFTDLDADETADFDGASLFYSIHGQALDAASKPLSGLSVALSGSKSDAATTDAQGNFVFADLPRGGSYTVTPAKVIGSNFSPAAKTFDNLTADRAQTFLAVTTNYKITGRVREGGSGLSAVTLTLAGSKLATTTTDTTGAYSFNVPANGDFTITPSKTHYTFDRAGSTFKGVASDQTAPDFVATLDRHRIAGTVKRPDGTAMAGVTLTLAGGQTATATTVSNGGYSFTNLPAGASYTVTPSKPGYDFGPASKGFADLGADQTADFNVTPANVALTGRVREGSAALAGVTVTLSGSKTGTALTDAQGGYSFSVSSEGSYTLTPSKTHYKFAPTSLSFTNPTSAQTADFAATLDRHSITGRVADKNNAGMSGATVALSGAQTATATTDAQGNFSFTNLPAGGNYTLAASKANYSFSPSNVAVNDLGPDSAGNNFTGTLVDYIIVGRITLNGSALAGATVTLSGTKTGGATTDAAGNYSFNVPAEGSFTVVPSLKNYTFSPPAAAFGNLAGNKTADFAATLNRHTVSGRVVDKNNSGMSGATVALSGTQSGVAVTDAQGNYSFANLPAGGSYTLKASKANYTFSPSSLAVGDLGADSATNNFTGALVDYIISGRATSNGSALAGVNIALSGSRSATATTDAAGGYSFTVPAEGSYTLTPSKQSYTFAPSSLGFNNLSSAQAADFAATLRAVVSFGAASYTAAEGGENVVVTVTRSGDTTTEVSAVYEGHGDTAKQGSDFVASDGLLTFAPGETSKSFALFITDDSFVEGPERFTLTLTLYGGAFAGDVTTATVTINDNDTTFSLINPADDDEFFVRQHYRDFFSRDPDTSGLKFWTDEIKRCGTDARCREARRVSVSAAFFLSIEFKETGYLVYKLYRASYGRAPARVSEFMLDSRVVGDGVVVGAEGWAERLAANKRDFLEEWVRRPEFQQRFGGLDDRSFLQALYANMGVALADARRNDLLARLGAGTSRADVLAEVIADAQFDKQEFNRAFVLMQYFGYLRRNPYDPPDADLTGYDYWLKKLDEFGGDYERAEMVKAFLSSVEYRGRFGN